MERRPPGSHRVLRASSASTALSLLYRSSLAFRAIEGRPAALHDAADAGATVAIGTVLALLAVDRPVVLEITEFAVRLDIVAEARAAGGDSALQYVADRLRQSLGAR